MSKSTSPYFLILGAGPAGLGAASALRESGQSLQILEAQERPLGRCKSHEIAGVFFDEGPHISFTKSPEIQELFLKNTDKKIHYFSPKISNEWNGVSIPHPVQAHLGYLPSGIRAQILKEIEEVVALNPSPESVSQNLETWFRAHFGRTFFQEFSGPYTRKYWTLDAAQMTTDWVGNRISRPDLSIIQSGARTQQPNPESHYFTEFRYPKHGGYQSFLDRTAQDFEGQTRLGSRITAIHPLEKWVEVNGQERVHYEQLISSIPMDLIPVLLIDAPSDLHDCASRLRCSSLTLYNILYRSSGPVTGHWSYVYDESIPFARYSFPKSLVNQGNDAIQAVQAEVYSSPYRPRDPRVDSIEEVLKGFEKLKLFAPNDVIGVKTQNIQHANIIFDHERQPARDRIHSYLKQHSIHGVGRYGSWRYLWSDESFLDGKSMVRRVP